MQDIQGNATAIGLLTGGGDKPYALGIATALTAEGIHLDFIGSDDLEVTELLGNPRINFLNLRGDQRSEASAAAKVTRILKYYARLILYAARAKPRIFHILWTNKFVIFDRTILLAYYKLLGKKLVLTAHNVNAGRRDSNDTWLNRLSLKIQYSIADHIFVHTEKMKSEMMAEFRVPAEKISVIPFGINNTVPNTSLARTEARRRLGINDSDKTMLFFGNIAPYKGLEYLVAAVQLLLESDKSYRLIIVGKPKGDRHYWPRIQEMIRRGGMGDRIIERIEYVPDEETELYFKATDVLVLPYAEVFQSGVLFLGYSFGVPVVAADVGTLKEEILEGKTGFVFKARDSDDLVEKLRGYFASDLFQGREVRQEEIKAYANERYSWSKVVSITRKVYASLLNAAV